MYANWTARAQLVSTFKWYKLDEIITFVHALRDYLLGTVGKLSASYMPTLNSTCPAAHKIRFPPEGAYVCEGIGAWNTKLDRLFLTVSIVVNTNKLERKYPGVRTQGEAEVTLLDCMDEILRSAELMQDVIDQPTFEQRYDLHWDSNPP